MGQQPYDPRDHQLEEQDDDTLNTDEDGDFVTPETAEVPEVDDEEED